MTDIVARLRGLGNAPFLEEAAQEIEQLRAAVEYWRRIHDGLVNDLLAANKHLGEQVSGIQAHAYDLTRQIKEMRAEIVRLRVEAGYD